MALNFPSNKLVELSHLLCQNPGPREYLVAGSMLSSVEDIGFPLPKELAALDLLEVDSYIQSVAKAFCSKDTDRSIEEAAKLTCQNAKDINVAFMGVTMALVMSDGERGTHNADRMVPIVRAYAKFLIDSMQLAKDGAEHGEEFDGDVVGACADPNIPINRRKLIIKQYITHAETLEATSNNMLDRLKSLRNEFFNLIQDVRRSNGKSRLASTEPEVDQVDWICPDVDLGHPILKLGFDLPGSLPPFLAIAGLMSLKREEVASQILFVSTSHAQRMAMKESTQSQDQESDGSALQLLTAFDKNFTKMGQCWFCSLLDARAIEKWLQTGADMASWSSYMRRSLNEGVKLYGAVAKYLRGYAKGIEDMHVEKWHVLD